MREQSVPSVLLVIDSPAGARAAGQVQRALGSAYRFLSFLTDATLRDVLGKEGFSYTLDPHACLAGADQFDLVLSFVGFQGMGPPGLGALLVGFFAEVGITVVEVQHQLFQEGFFPLAPEAKRCGTMLQPDGSTAMWRYAAHQLVSWGGQNGIGHLELSDPGLQPAPRSDLVSVVSALEQCQVSERERHLFAFAVIRAARSNPMLSFCWRVRTEELRHPAAAAVLQMVRDVALPNLWLDATEPVQQLIQRASFGVAMPCTALLTYQQVNRPVLVFACELLSRATAVHAETTFANYFELTSALEKQQAHPQGSRVHTPIEALRAEALDATLREAKSRSDIAGAWTLVAQRYTALFQTLAPVTVNVRAQEHELPKHEDKLNRILDRLGIIQRSTIGYKALKLMNALAPMGRKGPPK